jgi:hypothetical protein
MISSIKDNGMVSIGNQVSGWKLQKTRIFTHLIKKCNLKRKSDAIPHFYLLLGGAAGAGTDFNTACYFGGCGAEKTGT